MDVKTAIDLIQASGGYGVAGLLFWFWREANNERKRYRDNFEETLKELPKVAQAIEGLRDDLQKISDAPR